MPCAASRPDLQAAIDRLRKKWSLPRRNVEHLRPRRPVERCRRRVGAMRPGEQRGRRDVAVVALVAHLERLAGDGLEVDRAAARGGPRDSAGPRVLANQRRRSSTDVVVGAEAEHLAEALVERRERAVAGSGVLDDDDRHRRREDAGHRADRAVVVARRERRSRRASSSCARRLRRGWPSPRTGTRRSTAPWTGPHMRCPRDRRARCGGASGPPRPAIASRAGRTSTSIGWAPRIRSTAVAFAAAIRRPIGSVGSSSSRREQQAQLAIAVGRRPPVEGDDRRAGRADRLGEHGEADVDRPDAVGERVGDGSRPSVGRTPRRRPAAPAVRGCAQSWRPASPPGRCSGRAMTPVCGEDALLARQALRVADRCRTPTRRRGAAGRTALAMRDGVRDRGGQGCRRDRDASRSRGRRRAGGSPIVRIGRRGDDVLVPKTRIDHRVRPADGVLVVAEIEDLGRGGPVPSTAAEDELCLAGQRTAGDRARGSPPGPGARRAAAASASGNQWAASRSSVTKSLTFSRGGSPPASATADPGRRLERRRRVGADRLDGRGVAAEEVDDDRLRG